MIVVFEQRLADYGKSLFENERCLYGVWETFGLDEQGFEIEGPELAWEDGVADLVCDLLRFGSEEENLLARDLARDEFDPLVATQCRDFIEIGSRAGDC